ncbi:cyclin-like F-box protein [Medicago truncatula]|nr:cyclin-like F-box protein [Medicago truncatula]
MHRSSMEMDSFFGKISKYSGSVPSRKRKRNFGFPLNRRSESYEDCIVCFDGDDFELCDRMGCPNPYHPSCVKREKVLVQAKENLNSGTGEDKISALPDSLLYYILSFVSIKDAATTSILSKRWRPLWLSQLFLNLDDEPFPDSPTFCNFVYSLMAMRDITLPILSFHLQCWNDYDCRDIYNFLYIAIQRGVENLNIDFSHSLFSQMTLPSFVFSSKTLSILKLKQITLNEVPFVNLPSLKALYLDVVTFTYYELILKLLSGCPILQYLGTNNLVVELPYSERPVISLSNLIRANICDIHIEFDWLQNVERLRATVLMEKLPYTFQRIAMFHNLTYMELIINYQHFPRAWMFNGMIKLLEYCPKLQSLIIEEGFTFHKLYDEDWEEPKIILKCLSSHLRICSLRNFKGMKCGLHFAKFIMKNSRVLSVMTIQSPEFTDTNAKHRMLMELSSCPKSSTCKLLFE